MLIGVITGSAAFGDPGATVVASHLPYFDFILVSIIDTILNDNVVDSHCAIGSVAFWTKAGLPVIGGFT
jgi:hypothetical protein